MARDTARHRVTRLPLISGRWVAIGHRHALVDDGAIVIGLGALNSIEVIARQLRLDGAAQAG
jgi:hypothetical protein